MRKNSTIRRTAWLTTGSGRCAQRQCDRQRHQMPSDEGDDGERQGEGNAEQQVGNVADDGVEAKHRRFQSHSQAVRCRPLAARSTLVLAAERLSPGSICFNRDQGRL